MTFEQKRDACALFMRAHAQLYREAADLMLIAKTPEDMDIISDDMFKKAHELTVEEFYNGKA